MSQRSVCSVFMVFVFVLFASTAVYAHDSSQTTLIVAADEWCPYNCTAGSSRPGYAIELLEKVFAEHGIKIKYITIPWKRALEDTRAGTIDAAVGMVPSEAPDLILPEVEHGWYDVGFFTKLEDWKYTGRRSLEGMTFGVSAGYSYGHTVDGLIRSGDLKTEAMAGKAPLECNMHKLLYGRIQGVLADRNVFAYLAKQKDFTKSFYYGGSATIGEPLYVAFSPSRARSKEYAKMWSEGLVKLRASGEFAVLLAQYGLKDWR